MSEENVKLVRRWAHVIQDADPSGWAAMVDALFAPDAKWIEDERWPGSTTAIGRDAIKARVQDYNEGFGWRLNVDDILGAGSNVLMLIRAEGRGEVSGIETQAEWAFLLTFDADQVARWEVFLDRSVALEAAGLAE